MSNTYQKLDQQLDNAESIMWNLPPNETAGLATLRSEHLSGFLSSRSIATFPLLISKISPPTEVFILNVLRRLSLKCRSLHVPNIFHTPDSLHQPRRKPEFAVLWKCASIPATTIRIGLSKFFPCLHVGVNKHQVRIIVNQQIVVELTQSC